MKLKNVVLFFGFMLIGFDAWTQNHGANFSTTAFKYAADGVDFTSDKPGLKAVNRPNAPGAFRPDLTHPLIVGKELQWGICMIHNGPEAYLIRYLVILNPLIQQK